MSLIWFLLAVAYTLAVGVVDEKMVPLVSNNMSKKKISNLYSVSSACNNDGCTEISISLVMSNKKLSPQGVREPVSQLKPQISTASSRKLSRNYLSYNTLPKLFTKSIKKTMIKRKSGYSEIGLFLSDQQEHSIPDGDGSIHPNFNEESFNNSSFDISEMPDELNQSVMRNIKKMENPTQIMNISKHETFSGNLKFPPQEEGAKQNLMSSSELNEKFQSISLKPQQMTNNETKEDKTLIKNESNNQNSIKTFKGSRQNVWDDPEKWTFVNPFENLKPDNTPKEINFKSSKEFKPLMPDYEYILSEKPQLNVIEAKDETFDWYQKKRIAGLQKSKTELPGRKGDLKEIPDLENITTKAEVYRPPKNEVGLGIWRKLFDEPTTTPLTPKYIKFVEPVFRQLSPKQKTVSIASLKTGKRNSEDNNHEGDVKTSTDFDKDKKAICSLLGNCSEQVVLSTNILIVVGWLRFYHWVHVY